MCDSSIMPAIRFQCSAKFWVRIDEQIIRTHVDNMLPYDVFQKIWSLLPCDCDRTPETQLPLKTKLNDNWAWLEHEKQGLTVNKYTSMYPTIPELISPPGNPIAIIFSVMYVISKSNPSSCFKELELKY